MSTQPDLSRRDFLIKITIAGGALQTWPVFDLIAKADTTVIPSGLLPVISFHMDQPYLDLTGTATPYLPIDGCRSAEPLCVCDHEFLRHHYCYAV